VIEPEEFPAFKPQIEKDIDGNEFITNEKGEKQ